MRARIIASTGGSMSFTARGTIWEMESAPAYAPQCNNIGHARFTVTPSCRSTVVARHESRAPQSPHEFGTFRQRVYEIGTTSRILSWFIPKETGGLAESPVGREDGDDSSCRAGTSAGY